MVEFEVPPLTEEMLAMLSDQKEAIDRLFVEGILLSYSVSENRERVWAIMLASNEDELLDAINTLPLTIFMEYFYDELMIHNTVQLVPNMSLN